MFRKVLLAVSIAAASLGLAACESGPTPYQASTKWEGGYSESKIEETRYRISFKGNSLTERERVETYMLYRAAELTLQQGYDYFTIVSRDTDKDRRIRSSPGYVDTRLSYMYYVPRHGWVAAWEPYWATPSHYEEITRYEATAEIVLGKGQKGSDPNAFDARDVSKNLAGQIQRPAT